VEKPAQNHPGRPSIFTDEIASTILERIMEGESVRQICRDDSMPCQSSVFKWLSTNPEFAERYARAKAVQMDAMADEILDIADDGTNDWMERISDDDKPVGWVVNGEHIQRSRVRVDTRKWLMSKLAPKKYGEKVATELTGPNGGPLQVQEVRRTVVDPEASGE